MDPHHFGNLDPHSASNKNLNPDSQQNDKPDPHQFADDKLNCLDYELILELFQGFEPLFGS
jgi:hypothetical protein